MSVYRNAVYTQNGSTFADGSSAHANKNQFFSAELTQSCDDCYATMLADGVLLEPVSYTWDQGTYTLTVVKLVTSKAAYDAAVTFNSPECIALAEQAGWIFIPATAAP